MCQLNLNRVFFYLSTVFFRFIIDISYVFLISKIFSDENYFDLNFSLANYFISWLLYLAFLLLVTDRLVKISDYFFITGLLSVFAPITSLFGLNYELPFEPVAICFAVFLIIKCITSANVVFVKKMPLISFGEKLAISIASFFLIFTTVRFLLLDATLNLDFSKVYRFRDANQEILGGGIYNYINDWTYEVFSIYLMAICLKYRKFYFFILLVLIQIYFFAVTSFKSILFLPFLIFSIWFYFRKANGLCVVPLLMSVVVSLGLLSYFLFGDLWMSSLFTRRVFFVPAKLTFVYFDYFSTHPQIYWSNSFMSLFNTYPYDIPMSNVIGRYLGDASTSANNNFISSGYAHAGILGVLLYSFIFGFLLKFIDNLINSKSDVWFFLIITVVSFRNALINSDLLTTIFTHGFFIAIILMFLSRVKNNKSSGS